MCQAGWEWVQDVERMLLEMEEESGDKAENKSNQEEHENE